ncbi:LolA family protein [Lysobacter tyrosinilyticus]
MKFFSSFVMLLAFAAASPTHAQSGSDQLRAYDKTTYSGYLEVRVSLYGPVDTKGGYAAPTVYTATVLFERPDRFRLTINPGAKNEYRAVAAGGTVQWLDLATGAYGKAKVDEVVDPLASALLASVGELSRFGVAKDVALDPKGPVMGTRVTPMVWGTGVARAFAFFGADGRPAGFDYAMHDGSRVFLAVSYFKQNVKTSPQDFQL